jgi:hypothetical protein
MKNVTLTVNEFIFPADLKDKFAAFRLLVTLQYKDTAGNIVSVMEAIPGLGKEDYWECEKSEMSKPNSVRHPTLPQLDTDKVDETRREAVFSGLEFQQLRRVSVKIYDVEKDSKWDRALIKAAQVAFSVAIDFVGTGGPLTIGNLRKALNKKLAEDAKPEAVEKLVNDFLASQANAGKTRLIWEHSKKIDTLETGQGFTVTGSAAVGAFVVKFGMVIE